MTATLARLIMVVDVGLLTGSIKEFPAGNGGIYKTC